MILLCFGDMEEEVGGWVDGYSGGWVVWLGRLEIVLGSGFLVVVVVVVLEVILAVNRPIHVRYC